VAGGKAYAFRLFVAGNESNSTQARGNLVRLCEEHLKDRYELQIVDIYQQPTLAKDEQIIALPTLVKKLPLPLRRMIGDLSREDRVLLGLDLKPKSPPRIRRGTKRTEK